MYSFILLLLLLQPMFGLEKDFWLQDYREPGQVAPQVEHPASETIKQLGLFGN